MNNIMDLKEFFIGSGLIQPQTSWLLPVDQPFLEIQGQIAAAENPIITIELGTISSLEPIQKSLAVTNLTQQAILLSLGTTDPHLSTHWHNQTPEILLEKSGGEAELQLTIYCSHLTEEDIQTTIPLMAEMDSGAREEFLIQLHYQTITHFPPGLLTFNGYQTPLPHNFGLLDPMSTHWEDTAPYTVTLANPGKEALTFSLSSIPGWLSVTIEQQILESSSATFSIPPGQTHSLIFHPWVTLDFLGPQQTVIKMSFNDTRSEYKEICFQFAATLEIHGAHVTPAEPISLELVAGESIAFTLPLINWGNCLARISQSSAPGAFTIKEGLIIPMAEQGKPQRGILQVEFSSIGFKPGQEILDLELTLQGSRVPHLVVPIDVSIIKIVATPAVIDFDMVDPAIGSSRTVQLSASDRRHLNIMARPVPDLTHYLKVSMAATNTLEVSFSQPSGSTPMPLGPYHGPGIEILELDLKYSLVLPVNFSLVPHKTYKLCDKCLLVSQPELPFCSSCGSALINATRISPDMVVHCPVCARTYGSLLKYCPVDGSPLRKNEGGIS